MYSIYVIILYAILVSLKPTRKLALALLPWLIFALSYDIMRFYPNYKVNPIDTKDIFEAEKHWFGVNTVEHGRIILGQYFSIHNSVFEDLLAGFFYLCWVPVPLGFALYLYFTGKEKYYLQFSFAFLFINILGFIGYYVHPASPPWYVLEYGFTPVLNTPGNVAGLGRFDQLIGYPLFQLIYGKNANVFAAVPSLHATYMFVTTFYAAKSKQPRITTIVFGIICTGIWWTAVYSSHHYVIDVLLGIIVAMVGIAFLEMLVYRNGKIQSGIQKYAHFIRPFKHPLSKALPSQEEQTRK